jgi:phosphate transport system permease protein
MAQQWPAYHAVAAAEVRRLTGNVRREGVFAVFGSAAAAIALTELISNWFAPFTGELGFIVVWFPLFVALYGVVVSLDESGPAVRDRIASLVVHSVAVFLFYLLVRVILFPLVGGFRSLIRPNFYTQDLRSAGPLTALDIGGLQFAVVGTLEQITITLAITVPLGIACAVFLNESPGRLANLVRTVAAAATALPSIVAGLFIYALMILDFGLPESGFAAGLALSVMTLPIIIRASDVVLRLVPAGLKEASYALGASRWRTVLRVTLPTARSGLATAVILGAARGIGETSPVLLTAGYSLYTNTDPFSGPQTSLPLATFKLVTSGQPGYISRGYGAAALLMLLVLLLFIVARLVGGRGPGQLSGRQRRRRALASARIQARFQPQFQPEILTPEVEGLSRSEAALAAELSEDEEEWS